MTELELQELSIRARIYQQRHGTRRMGVLGAVAFNGCVIKTMWSTKVKISRQGLDIFRHWGKEDNHFLECNDYEACEELLAKLRVDQILDNLASIDLDESSGLASIDLDESSGLVENRSD